MNIKTKEEANTDELNIHDVQERIAYAKKSEEDFRQGRIYTPEEAIEELKERLKD